MRPPGSLTKMVGSKLYLYSLIYVCNGVATEEQSGRDLPHRKSGRAEVIFPSQFTLKINSFCLILLIELMACEVGLPIGLYRLRL